MTAVASVAENVALTVRRVSKVFGSGASEMRALDDVSVAIRPNEFFTLLGPSGCGKTTLLRLIAGFEFPTNGSIELDGRDIAQCPPHKRPINTVFQSYALFPHLSVRENVGFGLAMQGVPKRDLEPRVEEMLRLVQLEALADRRTDQISGGQAQRVALARALAPRPRVLLLDEPLSALDSKLRKGMQIELKRLQSETGLTFIFVTHDQEEALTMSDRIAVMAKGKILQVGSPRDIYERPANRFVADFIGDTNFLEGNVVAAADLVSVRLKCNGVVSARRVAGAQPSSGPVTIVVRPEHAHLQPERDGGLSGVVSDIVYTGTDTHFHVRLAAGPNFVVRSQNRSTDAPALSRGDAVGVVIKDGAAQVLECGQ